MRVSKIGDPSQSPTTTALVVVEASLMADTVPGLTKRLRDAKSSVRVRAAQALSMLGAEAHEAIPALIEVLQDDESYVQQWTATALGSIGPMARASVPALTEALLDDDQYVRDEASRALDRILEN